MRKRRQGIIILCMFLLCLCGCKERETAVIFDSEEQEVPEKSMISETECEEVSICVYICGQVNRPGVFEMPEGARITDAIDAAGGMTEEAACDFLNQAALLTDGQKIYVPTWEEAKQEEQSSKADGKVNINTADAGELMSLSGVGEAKAEAIIRYREEKGGFHSIEEIMNIEGIKEGVFHKIKDKISVD